MQLTNVILLIILIVLLINKNHCHFDFNVMIVKGKWIIPYSMPHGGLIMIMTEVDKVFS